MREKSPITTVMKTLENPCSQQNIIPNDHRKQSETQSTHFTIRVMHNLYMKIKINLTNLMCYSFVIDI